MASVLLYVVEDMRFHLPQLAAPFEWHETSAEQVTVSNYDSFIDLFSDTTGEKLTPGSVVILDLSLDAGAADKHKAKKQLLDDKFTDASDAVRNAYTNHIGGYAWAGLYLLMKILENASWTGLVVIASNRGGWAVERISTHLANKLRPPGSLPIYVKTAAGIISSSEEAEIVIEFTVRSYNELFGPGIPIEKRLWPDGPDCWRDPEKEMPGDGDTTGWFLKGNSLVPHNAFQSTDTTLQAIHQYLANLFGFSPPSAWLSDPEYGNLYEVLKQLVGGCALTGGMGGTYVPYLGTVILILAAAGGQSASEGWVKDFHWDCKGGKLFADNCDRAREALLALYELLLAVSKDKCSHTYLVSTAVLAKENKNRLLVSLNKDILAERSSSDEETAPDKTSLRDKLAMDPSKLSIKGDVFESWFRFIAASGSTTSGRRSKCTVNIYGENDGGNTQLEIVRWD